MQKDFCQVVLCVLPCLRTYGNIDMVLNSETLTQVNEELPVVYTSQNQMNRQKKKRGFFSRLTHSKEQKPHSQQKQSEYLISIEMPD